MWIAFGDVAQQPERRVVNGLFAPSFEGRGSTADVRDGFYQFRVVELGSWFGIDEQLVAGDCEAVRPTVDAIVAKMTIPLVQGTLRYAFKVGSQGTDGIHCEYGWAWDNRPHYA